MKNIKLALIGPNGKMGNLTKNVLSTMPNCSLVAEISRSDNLDLILKSTKPDIAIEFTSHESVFYNAQTIIANNVYPIIGSSGLSVPQIDELTILCKEKMIGGLVIPNFSLGMAFICKLVNDLKQHYDEFSLIEFHHTQKKDKPSGTGKYIANILGIEDQEILSIRSKGFVAKQQIYISSDSERIILDQESFDRNSFSKGISLSINKVMSLNNLVVGLENII